MDSHSRTIEVKLLCADLPAPALLDQVGREVSQIYGLRGVTFRPACPQVPAGVEEPMPPPPGEEDAPAAPRGCRRPPHGGGGAAGLGAPPRPSGGAGPRPRGTGVRE